MSKHKRYGAAVPTLVPTFVPGVVSIGIDPGHRGALALVDDERVIELMPMPMEPKPAGKGFRVETRPILEALRRWKSEYGSPHVYIESGGPRPGEGVVSAATAGEGRGVLRCAIDATDLPVTFVRPQAWRSAAGLVQRRLSYNERKRLAAARFAEVYPEQATIIRGPAGGLLDGVADAALIARFGRLG